MVKLNEKDDIVISGIAGIFPTCRNVKEFQNNLYSKVDMVNDDESRWKHTNPLIPKLSGKIPEINKFDSTFFGIFHPQANSMDPQSRMLIEEAFKCVVDAGVNPNNIRGSNMGVYLAVSFSDAQNYLFYNNATGNGITGGCEGLFANRISYALGLNGPSLTCNSASSSSLTAFNLAYLAIKSGAIDAAIVGSSNIILHPGITVQLAKLGMITTNGHSCPFDEEANGYVRSEAVSCVFLQKRSVAKRVYATAVQIAINNDGFKPEGIIFPSRIGQEKLLQQVYDKANINLNDLGYFEAHCSGIAVSDSEECAAIDNAICKRRNQPLLVGSVKSNCGHTEATAGLCGLIKVIFAMENNIIPPNINLKTPKKTITALHEGRMQVVTEPTALAKPYIGINSFGFGGANGHLLLKQFEKTHSDCPGHVNTLPRLITWSSRTEQNFNEFMSYLVDQPLDEEFLALAQNSQLNGIQGMLFRGYGILKETSKKENPIMLQTQVKHDKGTKRPLIWVFSGMGSQWVGMGKQIMQLPFCKESIQKSHETLLPMGIDLINILTSDDPMMFDDIIHSFVGIGAIQIALVDLLKELGIVPDFVIGHSVGELGCGYADNGLTAEQMILTSYYRGKVSREVTKILGSMAAIGMGYKDVQPILPQTIDVACHNSSESCTISGPQKDVREFVESLKAENIFAREVQCSNIPYHSRYIAQFGPELFKYLKKILRNPNPRSNKWISTSVPRTQWLKDDFKYCSAEYHTNNLLSSVLFEEAFNLLPKNALTIEIAPHALLQSIVKGSISDGVYIGLTKRNVDDGILYLLNALGSLYTNGVEFDIGALYPKVSWPVSRGTPSLGSLIKFDHSREFTIHKVEVDFGSGIKKFVIRLNDQKYQYLAGLEIDGRILIPAGFYLDCVWRTFADLKDIDLINLSVEFESVKFLRTTTMNIDDEIVVLVFVHTGTGQFEITESDNLVATGIIQEIVGKTMPAVLPLSTTKKSNVVLEKKDFYNYLKLRGYHYTGDFQSVNLTTDDGSYGKIVAQENWVVAFDSMLQLSVIRHDSRSVMIPTKIRSLSIYPQYHKYSFEQSSVQEIFYSKFQNKTICGGIEINDLDLCPIERKKYHGETILEKYQFVSHFPAVEMCLNDVARCCIELLEENECLTSLQITEFPNSGSDNSFLTNLKQAVTDLPLISATYVLCHKTKDPACMKEIEDIKNIHLDEAQDAINPFLLVLNANDLDSLKSTILTIMDPNGFLIIRGDKNVNSVEKFKCPSEFIPIAFFPTKSETIVLVQRINKNQSTSNDNCVLHIASSDTRFEWLPKLQEICKTSNNIILVSRNDKFNGIIGLVNCLRRELTASHIRCVLIDDVEAPEFDPNLDLYKSQLRLNLVVNVYRKGKWGTYRHLLLEQNYHEVEHSNHVYANILRKGDLSSLKWIEGPLQKSDINVKIMYSSLNFHDAMIASSRLPINASELMRNEEDCIFGHEYSGIDVKSGRSIMGMVPKAGVASDLSANTMLSWQVPQGWSLSEAATVPVAYFTAYYAFFSTVDISKGKSILIHAGSGGIGMAAIRVALAYGLEVYTTVSTAEKKAFLLKNFPSLRETHIGNSRDTSFEYMIKRETENKGVDFVLNSLSGDSLLASARCCRARGHFINIGKFDAASDNSLGLGIFVNELSFHAVNIDHLFTASEEFVNDIKELMKKDIAKGIIKPLPATIYKAHEIEQAFRYLISGKHIGKVMIQIRESLESNCTLPISVLPRIYFSPISVYVILGGLEAIGLEFVDWMMRRGARKIVLNSRRGITNGYQKFRMHLWKKNLCHVVTNTADIGLESGCMQLLNDAMKLGPIGGIFNLEAVMVKDVLLTSQTKENFEAVLQSKSVAMMHLDRISRKVCPHLKYFLVYSSIICGRGDGGGQTSIAMGNSIMERIIEDRVAQGLPGKAIQWGALGNVGCVPKKMKRRNNYDLQVCGTLPQNISSHLEVLDALLSSTDPIVCSMVVAEKREMNKELTLIKSVLSILDIHDIKTVSMASTLLEVGLDSMLETEIKHTLESEYNIVLNVADIRNLTFQKLKELSDI